MTFLGLSQEEFWSDPYRTRDEVVARLMDGQHLGYFVDAPPQVNVEHRDTIPVVGVRHLSIAEGRAVDFRRCGLAVAVHVERGEVCVGRAFAWKNPTKPRAAPKPGRATPAGSAADLFKVDLKQQLPDLNWSGGTVLTNLLILERSSNRVTIHLEGAVGDVGAPPLRGVWPLAGEGAQYSNVDGLLPMPDGYSIFMQVPRVVVQRPGARCEVRGRVRVPIAGHNVVPLPPTDPQARSAWQPPDVGDRRATGLIPLTLVLAQAESLEVIKLQYVMPVYQDLDPAGGTMGEAEFCVDLFAHPDMVRIPQTYQLWAYAGAEMIGPHPLGVVSEERLTPG